MGPALAERLAEPRHGGAGVRRTPPRADLPPIPADVLALALGLDDVLSPEQLEPAPPFGCRCAWRGCEVEPVAVAARTLAPYCAHHGTIHGEVFRRRIVWFPKCEVNRCGRLAIARMPLSRRGERERSFHVCASHGSALARLFPSGRVVRLYDESNPTAQELA